MVILNQFGSIRGYAGIPVTSPGACPMQERSKNCPKFSERSSDGHDFSRWSDPDFLIGLKDRIHSFRACHVMADVMFTTLFRFVAIFFRKCL